MKEPELERVRAEEIHRRARGRMAAEYGPGGDIVHLNAAEINEIAAVEGWPEKKRLAFLGEGEKADA